MFPRLAASLVLAMAAFVTITVPILSAEKNKSAENSDEAAIRAAIDTYVAAYNRGDAKAVAAHWSETGEWLSPSGQKFQGREAIEREMKSMFDDEKGAHIEVINATVRLISPNTAIEEGTVRVTHPTDPPSESTYLAVDVKENGRWKLNTVRETDMPDSPAPSSELDELSWLVGDWVDDSPDVDDVATVKWTKNKAFLSYSFKASSPDSDDELEGTQIIGWDPAAGTIRSWMFDSDGGFGEGTWSKHGDTWVVKFSQVLSDGRMASATNVYTMVNGNTFTWKSIGRKLDGEFLPNIDEVKMVRKSAMEAVEKTSNAPVKAKSPDKAPKSAAKK
jgi:uncharacterized protein (TIGR02246 family)